MSSKVGARAKVKPEKGSEQSPPASVDESSLRKEDKGSGGNTQHRTSKLGRKGDPRMHRAVAARLANPDITLLEALRAGGFQFPDCDEKGGTLDGTVCDSDNVQLCQRKNQLSRRLRLARQAKGQKPGDVDEKGGGKLGKKRHDYEDEDGNELTPEAQDRLRLLIQQTQQRGKANHMSKKRKDGTGGSYKRMLSISAEDEVEVVEEDPYEEEIGPDSSARRAKNHPLFQQRQLNIPTTAWGAAAQLGLAGIAATGAAASAQAAGQTTAAQQLQQAAAAYGAASSNTAAGTALAMAQARGGAVPAAAQHSFSFWPSLAAGGVQAAAAQRIIQQQQAQAQQHAQAQQQKQQAQAEQQQKERARAQQQQQRAPTQPQKTAGGRGGTLATPGGNNATNDGAAPSGAHSLALTAASLGMSQDQLAVVLGGSGLSAGMQGLPQLAGAQARQQTQAAPSPIAATGASSTPAAASAGSAGAGGGLSSDNVSTCSSLSARDQVATALRQAAGGSGPPGNTAALDDEGRMSMALDILRTESASLLKRCMLMAGFEPSQTEECDWRYLEFAERAAEEEKHRIARIQARVGDPKGDAGEKRGGAAGSSCGRGRGAPGSSCGHGHGKLAENGNSSPEGNGKHQHGMGCSHAHDESDKQGVCFDGRHVHRLEGKCGHQAVIHQPEGGPPHVDFVVDNKIECYGGVQGIKHVGSSQAFWPSKFSCDELLCESRQDSNHGVTCGEEKCDNECGEVTKKIEPKVLELNDIDFDGKEWNKDSAGDDTLLGLMSLGDKTPV